MHEQSTNCIKSLLSKASDWAFPFFQILRENKSVEWKAECEGYFQEIKKHVHSQPTLTKPIPCKTLFLHSSSSNRAFNAVYVKDKVKVQLPIYYVCKLLTSTEHKYIEIEKYLHRLVITAQKLHTYFLVHEVMVITDKPLKHFLLKSDDQERW